MIILRKRVPGLSETMLESFLQKARRAVGLRGTVNVLVTSSRELQSLNARFRDKDAPTDVLSFPPLSNLPEDFAGDIAISAAIAGRNARVLGHSAADEIKVLILHGLLHLAGYDHERDNGKMGRKERRLRRNLGLPLALIERTEAKGRAGTAASASLRTSAPVSGRRAARRPTAVPKTSATRRQQ